MSLGDPRRRALARLTYPDIGGTEKSLTNEGVTTSAYRPFCDDNVLVLVALTS